MSNTDPQALDEIIDTKCKPVIESGKVTGNILTTSAVDAILVLLKEARRVELEWVLKNAGKRQAPRILSDIEDRLEELSK